MEKKTLIHCTGTMVAMHTISYHSVLQKQKTQLRGLLETNLFREALSYI